MGHLRSQCTGRPISQNTCPGLCSSLSIDVEEEKHLSEVPELAMDLSNLSLADSTLIGKLKLISPSLVMSLTLEEFHRLKSTVLNERHVLRECLYREGLSSFPLESGGLGGTSTLVPHTNHSMGTLPVTGVSTDTCPQTDPGDSSSPLGRGESSEGLLVSHMGLMGEFAQPYESESLSEVVSSSGDINLPTKLPIYMGGHILIDKPSSGDLTSSGTIYKPMCEPIGSIRGGLEPEFSPLKTRSARKQKGVLESTKLPASTTIVPRALREQKALARGLK